jgi:hypothetical protein
MLLGKALLYFKLNLNTPGSCSNGKNVFDNPRVRLLRLSLSNPSLRIK